MSVELTQGYVSLAIDFANNPGEEIGKFFSTVQKQSSETGKEISKTLAAGIEGGAAKIKADMAAARREMETTAKAAQAARDKEESAARKAEIAELKLAEARESGKAKASQLLALEDRLATAKKAANKASLETVAAEKKAADAHEETERAAVREADALKDLAREADNAGDKSKNFGRKLADGLKTKVTTNPFRSLVAKAGDSGEDAGKKFSSQMEGGLRRGVGKLDVKSLMAGAAGGLAAAAGAALGGGAVDLVKNSIAEAQDSAKVGQLTASQLKATGAAAWATSDSIGHLAETISNKTGIDDEAVQSSANMLLSFKAVKNAAGEGANIFDRATVSAQDLAATGLTSAEGATKALGKALQDPIKGLGGLSKAGVTFTQSEKDKVKALVESGKQLEAQKMIMGKVESVSGGAAAASATASEKLATMWGNTQEALGTALLPLVDKAAIGLGKILPIISEKLPVAIEWLGDKAKPLTDNLGHLVDLLFKGDFTGSIFGLEEDSPAVAGLLKVRDFVKDLPTSAKNLYSLLFKGDFTGGIFGLEEDSPAVAGLLSARDAIKDMLGFVSRHQTAFGAIATGVLAMVGAFKLYQGVMTLVRVATTIYAGAQGVLNAVMSANPIGIVVLALVGLAAGLVYAYKHSETFRRIVTNAWSSVKNGASSAWNFMRDKVLAPMGRFFTQTIPNATKAMGRGISSVWDGIKAKTSGVWTSVRDNVLNPMKNFFTQTIPGAARSMGRGIAGMWDGIKSKANSIWGWLRDKALTPMKTFLNKTIPDAAAKARDGFKEAWDGLKHVAAQPVLFIVESVYQKGLRSALSKIPGADKILPDAQPQIDALKKYKNGGIVGGRFNRNRRDNVLALAANGVPTAWVEPGEMVVNRDSTAKYRDALQAMNAGTWPVGPLGEQLGGNQNTNYETSSIPRTIPGVPTDILRVIQQGPSGSGGFGGATDWGLAHLGDMGWWRRCLAFVNAAWGHSVPRFGKATARQSMNAGPLYQGVPPAGAAAYYNTSGYAGHVALSMGDGTVLSNDIVKAGRIDRVPYDTFARAWRAPYAGWWHPSSTKTGALSDSYYANPDIAAQSAAQEQDVKDGIAGVMAKVGKLKSEHGGWGQLFSNPIGSLVGNAKNWALDKVKAAAGAVVDGVKSTGTRLAGGPATMLGEKMAESRGWTGNEWDSLHKLWDKESGWNPLADNPTSDAYGIPQALPGSKMRSAGWDWRTNAATQIRWGLGYIADRYGSPSAAWAHSQRHNWYDQGGFLPTGQTAVMNGTGDVEPVFTNRQWQSVDRLAGAGALALSGVIDGAGSFGSGGKQVIVITGDLTLNEDGTAFIEGVAQDVYDANSTADARRSIYA